MHTLEHGAHPALETEEPFFTPETAEEFHAWAQELKDELEPVDPDQLKDVKLHWRGIKPGRALGFVGHQFDEYELRGDRPNTTLDPYKAISYGLEEGERPQAFTVALGFLPEKDWQISPAQTRVPEDLKGSDTVMGYQKGNFIVKGKLHREDVQYVAVRFTGDKPGQVGPIELYAYHAKEKRPSTELH